MTIERRWRESLQHQRFTAAKISSMKGDVCKSRHHLGLLSLEAASLSAAVPNARKDRD